MTPEDAVLSACDDALDDRDIVTDLDILRSYTRDRSTGSEAGEPFAVVFPRSTEQVSAILFAQDVAFRPKLTCFLPVRLVSNAAGTLLALPVHTNTSGDFASLSGTDGYVELALRGRDAGPVLVGEG